MKYVKVFLTNNFEQEKKKKRENMTLSNIRLLESEKNRHISQTILNM